MSLTANFFFFNFFISIIVPENKTLLSIWYCVTSVNKWEQWTLVEFQPKDMIINVWKCSELFGLKMVGNGWKWR